MPSRPDIIFNANEGLFTPLAHKRRYTDDPICPFTIREQDRSPSFSHAARSDFCQFLAELR